MHTTYCQNVPFNQGQSVLRRPTHLWCVSLQQGVQLSWFPAACFLTLFFYGGKVAEHQACTGNLPVGVKNQDQCNFFPVLILLCRLWAGWKGRCSAALQASKSAHSFFFVTDTGLPNLLTQPTPPSPLQCSEKTLVLVLKMGKQKRNSGAES